MDEPQTTSRSFLQIGGTCYRSAAVTLLYNILPHDSALGALKEMFDAMDTVHFEVQQATNPLATLLAAGVRAISKKKLKAALPLTNLNTNPTATFVRKEYCPRVPPQIGRVYKLCLNAVADRTHMTNNEIDSILASGQIPTVEQLQSSQEVNTTDGGAAVAMVMALLYHSVETFRCDTRFIVLPTDPQSHWHLTSTHFPSSDYAHAYSTGDVFTLLQNDKRHTFHIIHDVYVKPTYFSLTVPNPEDTLENRMLSYFESHVSRWELKGFLLTYRTMEDNHVVCMFKHKQKWIIVDSNEGEAESLDVILKNIYSIAAVYKSRQRVRGDVVVANVNDVWEQIQQKHKFLPLDKIFKHQEQGEKRPVTTR